MTEPVPVEQRERDYEAALHHLEVQAADWLNRRTRGIVPPRHDQLLTDAIQGARRTERRLRETEKRESRAA